MLESLSMIKTWFLTWWLQGFPGDMGPPGENGQEGPKVTKAAVELKNFFEIQESILVQLWCFFGATLTKGMKLIKFRLNINRQGGGGL